MKTRLFSLALLAGMGLSGTLPSGAAFDPAARVQAIKRFQQDEGKAIADINDSHAYAIAEQFRGGTRKGSEYVRFELFLRFAEQGDPGEPPVTTDHFICAMAPHAQFRLGQMYEEGNGTPQDNAKALFYYRQAAKNGARDAYYKLARAYETNRLGVQDLDKAALYYELARRDRFPLGVMYEEGRGVPRNLERALEIYESESGLIRRFVGNPDDIDVLHAYDAVHADTQLYARYRLARMYRMGEATSRNPEQAARYMFWADREEMSKALLDDDEQLIGKAPFDADAQLSGAADVINYGSTRSYFMEAQAEVDSAIETVIAKARKPSSVSEGEIPIEAVAFYRNARKAEYTGSGRDTEKALDDYRQAAAYGLPQALTRLGWYHELGFHVTQDDAEAAKLYSLSNDLHARYRLAVLYRDGRGVERDERKAFELLDKVVRDAPTIEQQRKTGIHEYEFDWLVISATYHLAMMHEEGIGTPKDPAKALSLMKEVERVSCNDFTSNDRTLKNE